MKTVALRTVAVAAYAAYWALWSFGYLDSCLRAAR
jgi:hypothetical protein